jgi:cell division protein FtsL
MKRKLMEKLLLTLLILVAAMIALQLVNLATGDQKARRKVKTDRIEIQEVDSTLNLTSLENLSKIEKDQVRPEV